MLKYKMSASQLALVLDIQNRTVERPFGDSGCLRKWGYRYLEKLREPSSDALVFGRDFHSCLEESFTMSPREWARKWPPEYTQRGQTREKIAAMAVAARALRPPGKGVAEMSCFDDISELDTSIHIKPDYHTLNKKTFCDWKSTSSNNRRGKFCLQQPSFYMGGRVPAQVKLLSDDIQARLYARGLMKRWGKTSVDALWVYVSKRFGPGETPKAWTTKHTFERDETEEWVRAKVYPAVRLLNTLRDAWADKTLVSSQNLLHNISACGEIGRFCGALAQCKFEPSRVPAENLGRYIHGSKKDKT